VIPLHSRLKETSQVTTLPLLIAISLLGGCASTTSATVSKVPSSSDASTGTNRSGTSSLLSEKTGESELKKIQKLFEDGNPNAVLEAVQKFDQKFPKSMHRIGLANLKGLAFLTLAKPRDAQSAFRFAAQESSLIPDPEIQDYRPFYLYNLAAAQEQGSEFSEAFQTLTQIPFQRLDLPNRIKYHSLKSRLFRKKNDPISEAGEYIKISRLTSDSDSKGTSLWVQPLEDAARRVASAADLEQLVDDSTNSSAQAVVLWVLGLQEERENQKTRAKARFERLIESHPSSAYRILAEQRLKIQEQQNPTASPYTIGALLPLRGKFSRFGQRALQGLQLSLEIFEPKGNPSNKSAKPSPFTLVVEDSGETPEDTQKAFEKLVNEHHVLAVVGPLLSKGIDTVSELAAKNQIPLVTLSQQNGQPNDFVFPLGITTESQAEEIATYAIKQLGLKRFAILHPQDKFGEQYAQAFWDAVEKLGGEIRGIESYAPGETDFRTPIDKLAGVYYGDARAREMQQLSELRSENKIKKKNRKTEKFFNLPPLVDFDAVFIPDEPRTIGMATPTFAYRDVDRITFLGTASWHSQDLGNRLQNLGSASFFPDAFILNTSAPDAQKFISQYRDTFNQDPSAIDAIAFDAGRLLKTVILQGDPSLATQPNRLRESLESIPEYGGVSGKISRLSGKWSRTLRTFTLKSGQIVDAP